MRIGRAGHACAWLDALQGSARTAAAGAGRGGGVVVGGWTRSREVPERLQRWREGVGGSLWSCVRVSVDFVGVRSAGSAGSRIAVPDGRHAVDTAAARR